MTKQEKAAQAAESLAKARELLKAKGWTKGAYTNWRGQYCLVGAINKVNGPGQEEAKRLVRNCIGMMEIENWNDRGGRTFEEVEAVLLAAENIAKELAE